MKKVIAVILLTTALLSACTTTTPSSCTARERVDVYASIPSAHNVPAIVDWLDAGESTLVMANVEGWYEVVTPRLVDGYANAQVCEANDD